MKNKKEFFGVLFSVLISVFLVFLGVYATTTVGNDVTVGDDLIVTEDVSLTGNEIGFGNGASISNAADAELLTLTETLVSIVGKASVSTSFNVGTFASIGEDLSIEGGDFSVSGDATITGNDLTFGNAGTIVNTDADTFTLTEQLFDLNGSLDVSNDLIVGTGPLQVGSTATVAYSRFGAGTTGYSSVVSASSDLLISDALEVDGRAFFDGPVSFSETTTAITTGGTAIEWDGASEWMRIFLENQDTSPGSSGVVMSLINNASITSGDQITLELKGDIASGTELAAGDTTGHLTTLRTRVEFKGTSTYTSGEVQPLNAVLGADSGVTLTGSNLRAGNFRVRLQSEPGHAEILLLENDSTDENYVDTFIYFHGGDTSSSFEFYETDTEAWKGATADLYDVTDGVTTLQADAIIKIKIGGTFFWIPAFDAASVTNE